MMKYKTDHEEYICFWVQTYKTRNPEYCATEGNWQYICGARQRAINTEGVTNIIVAKIEQQWVEQ
jgi:hypothetical protein